MIDDHATCQKSFDHAMGLFHRERDHSKRVVEAARAIYAKRKNDDLEDELREVRLALEAYDAADPDFAVSGNDKSGADLPKPNKDIR